MDAHSCASLGIDSFRTCRVPHFATSCAASLTFSYEDNGQKNTFKLTYSGDTVPCEEIIELGRDSTLLIHESTVLDKEEEWAAKSKHSTVSQAVNQGRLMNAKYTMLTHFSRRYREMPWIRKQLPENVGVAFDFMHVAYDDLQRLNSLIPKYLETFNRRPMEQNHDKKIICNTSRILYDDDE